MVAAPAVGQPSPLLKQLPESIGGPARPITLSDALAVALSRNPDLLVNRQDLAIADRTAGCRENVSLQSRVRSPDSVGQQHGIGTTHPPVLLASARD